MCIRDRHCARSRGGLWFAGYADFEGALDRLLGDPVVAGSLAAAGRSYVATVQAWPSIIERYRAFLGMVAGAGTEPSRHTSRVAR